MSDEVIRISFSPREGVRAVYTDSFPFALLGYNPPVRASHVEAITSGPCAWQWSVDLSPLGEGFQFCLWPPYTSYTEAVAAEVAYINQHWVRYGQKEKEKSKDQSVR
jgi:hypothetical protein